MKTDRKDNVHVRLLLSPEQVEKFATIQRFLGLRSLSAAVARCALWNADALSAALSEEGGDKVGDAVAPMVGEFVKAAMKKAGRCEWRDPYRHFSFDE